MTSQYNFLIILFYCKGIDHLEVVEMSGKRYLMSLAADQYIMSWNLPGSLGMQTRAQD